MSDKLHNGLTLRILSALLLMPFVLGAVLEGGLVFGAMLALAFLISVKEWFYISKRGFSVNNMIFGVCYILFSCLMFYYLREHFPDGAGLCLCLMLCIWASDSGAYFAGKAIGGPKMAPTISPNKTWAGLIGGALASAAGFVLYALYVGPWLTGLTNLDLSILEDFGLFWLALIGASITITGQAGDLLESYVKRRAGVKDSGSLIPGHGGLLDRIDSLLLAAPLFVITLKAFGL